MGPRLTGTVPAEGACRSGGGGRRRTQGGDRLAQPAARQPRRPCTRLPFFVLPLTRPPTCLIPLASVALIVKLQLWCLQRIFRTLTFGGVMSGFGPGGTGTAATGPSDELNDSSRYS